MTALRLCFLIFCAGGCGALARFGMTQAVGRFITSSYPLGILVVNVLGSFLFGFVWELAAVRMMIADATRVVLCVGFMGSFTTFSSLIFDSFMLAQTRPVLLLFNIVIQVVLGFAALYGGIQAARLI